MSQSSPLWRGFVVAVALACSTATSWAAREFTPQAGLWMIPSEIDGKPGRGFSLDVQGNTAFLQIFNYEKSGAATFHTAVGKLDEQASMTVPLQRFKGGRYFGGPAQDAVSDGSVGSVTVKFSDGLNGTVQFPGESEQPVARYLVPQKLPLWWTQLSNDPPSGKDGYVSLIWTATSPNGDRHFWNVGFNQKADGKFSLGLSTPVGFQYSQQNFSCELNSDTQVFDCLATPSNTNGDSPAPTMMIKRLRFRTLGWDVVGEIQPALESTQRITLNGWNWGSFSCNDPTWCNSPKKRSTRTFGQVSLGGETCITGSCSGYNHIMLQPTSGAWIIDDENTGKPGRGVFLDVQDNTLIVQTSDYLANGEPVFHMGVANLKSSATRLDPTTSEMSLLQYAGGRYFGGPAQSGNETANAGALKLRFAPQIDGKPTNFDQGEIQLPNEEGFRRMRRLALESNSGGLDTMLGEYLLRWRTRNGRELRWMQLTHVENNIAQSQDGLFQCYTGNSPTPNRMGCAWLPTPSMAQEWTGSAGVIVTPFHREDASSDSLLRTRDRHGNWIGLGKVNLPGLTIPAE